MFHRQSLVFTISHLLCRCWIPRIPPDKFFAPRSLKLFFSPTIGGYDELLVAYFDDVKSQKRKQLKCANVAEVFCSTSSRTNVLIHFCNPFCLLATLECYSFFGTFIVLDLNFQLQGSSAFPRCKKRSSFPYANAFYQPSGNSCQEKRPVA